AELLRSLVHRKTHYAVKTDRRQNECDDPKDREQSRDEAIGAKNLVMKGRRCTRKIDWEISIQLRDRPAQCRAESFCAVAAARPNNDGAKLRYQIASEKGHVESRRLGLLIEWSLHQSVGNDSDNRAPRLGLARIKNADLMTECALIAPILSG